MSRILRTDGTGSFYETEWHRPAVKDDEIAVKTILTGVCRSDVDMMQGDFPVLPVHMSGHEGLGQVIEVGQKITHVRVGDYVATQGEPAYADEYNVRNGEFVTVPEPSAKYILEPVACGINVVLQAQPLILHKKYQSDHLRTVIMGSGFLAWVAYHTMQKLNPHAELTVVGNSNKAIWGNVLQPSCDGPFDMVIDLVGKDHAQVNNGAIMVNAVAKPQTVQQEQQLLWKACYTVRPSPRTKSFYDAMLLARDWISNGTLQVDHFWSKGYSRNSEWQQAFEDAVNRPQNYSRGYIKWD
jgi:D-arabinose 1-dehydrogenase-like Zn-dependent alcohol dehydrogenase